MVLILGITGGYYLNAKLTDSINIQDVLDMRNQMDQYKQQELEQKEKELKLQSIHNRQVVTEAFNKVGKILVYKGGMVYKDSLVDKGFLHKKELDLYLKYDIGISVDLKYIDVVSVVDDTVLIKLPEDKFDIEYVELNLDETELSSYATWFADNYEPEEVRTILDLAKKNVIIVAKNNDQIYKDSYDSLKNEVEKLLKKLGYEQILFQ